VNRDRECTCKAWHTQRKRYEAIKTCKPDPFYMKMLGLECDVSWDDMWTAPARFEVAAAIGETVLSPSSCDPDS